MSPRMGLDLYKILQSAAEIADKQGNEALTLASLAKKLGIQSPSLYNHVKGLPNLRNKLAVYGFEQLYCRLTADAQGKSGDEAIRSLAHTYITFARQHPGLYKATLQAPEPHDAELQRAGKAIVDLVVQALNPYGLNEEEVLHAVRGLRSMLHGFAVLEQRGGFGLELDRDQSLCWLINTFLAGVQVMTECAGNGQSSDSQGDQ